jgi:hypothetical protein
MARAVMAILVADAHETTDSPELLRARIEASEARVRLGHYLDALEAGRDPAPVTEGTRVTQENWPLPKR